MNEERVLACLFLAEPPAPSSTRFIAGACLFPIQTGNAWVGHFLHNSRGRHGHCALSGVNLNVP